MPFSTYLSNHVLEHVTGKTAYTAPTVYVALSTSTPALDGTGVTEPSTGSYARVATSAASWAAAASGSIANSQVITFPTATADWAGGANFTYGVLYDAATAGNVLGYGALSVAKNCQTGDTTLINVGQLTITLS